VISCGFRDTKVCEEGTATICRADPECSGLIFQETIIYAINTVTLKLFKA